LYRKLVTVEQTADQQTAFLTLDGGATYQIAPNSVMNIGRLETNDVVLDDYKVSREHAVLKYSGSEFVLVDLASTHGTYVNGTRIDRSPVQFGDKIQITSHELTVSQEMPASTGGDHSVPTPKKARTLDRRLKFFGGLNEFSLITLVQFLSQEKQSGLLLLELGQHPGPRLYFQDGEIIHVSDGEDLAELLTRQYHEQSLFFYFHHETNFPPRTIAESTPNYLMNLCHNHDVLKVQKVTAAAMDRTTGPLAMTTKLDGASPKT
jgi:pSer/pThr/pTyr-binding forkhead associated (FHA) protein